MPSPLIRYELDPTGLNPDNLIQGEIHTLSINLVRAITPTYGPYFAESVRLVDTSNARVLVRGIDYQCVELLQDATLRYGKEISSVILIINQDVTADVSLDYQTLGGYFSNDSTAIATLYDEVINDNRPVQWENVLNKPLEYPPTLHRHLMDDMYGFEPVVAAIERLRNAILLTDVPAFEAVLDIVNRKVNPVPCHEVLTNTPHLGGMTYWSHLASLTHKYLLSDYRFKHSPIALREGTAVTVEVECKDPTRSETLRWEIIHDTTIPSDFNQTTGSFDVRDGVGKFVIQIDNDHLADPNACFGLGLKHMYMDSDYIAISCRIRTLNEHPIAVQLEGYSLAIPPDLTNYRYNDITAVSVFMSSSKDADRVVFSPNTPDIRGIEWRDLIIPPDLMSFWNTYIDGYNMFMSSAKDS